MIKRISTLMLIAAVMFTFAVPSGAQMKDDEVIKYMDKAMSSGKSQGVIAKELAAKGLTAEQFMSLKEQLESGAIQTSASHTVSAKDRTRNMDTRLLELEFKAAVDSLAGLDEDKFKVFGQSIFANKNLNFAPNLNIPTPSDYKLGPGDEVIIDIWGSNEATIRQVISPDGFISIPDVGLVSLNGMTVKEADSYLRKKMGRSYPVDGENADSDIKLTLGNIRTIHVNVVGEVVNPGTYFVSSLSTVYNALYLAGGVSEVGSLREISLVRNNRKVASVDLYDFIINGKTEGDVVLKDGDVITVPAYKNIVDVAGKVKRPMKYEMKDGESVMTALEYSGGFTGDAYKSNIRLIRRNGVEYQLYTVDAARFGEFELMDGDSLTVGQMVDRYENKVEIQGAVYQPGAYQLGDGISTVAQLVRKAEGLKGDAFVNRALLFREKEDLTREVVAVDLRAVLNGTADDIMLMRNDSLHVSSIHDIKDIGTISIDGEVTLPGTYAFVDNMTIEDAILQAGGMLESASTAKIDISRRIKNQASQEEPDSIGQSFTLTFKDGYVVGGGKDFILEPYDHISVRKSPGYFEQISVTISGEVVFPGSYALTHKNEIGRAHV